MKATVFVNLKEDSVVTGFGLRGSKFKIWLFPKLYKIDFSASKGGL